LFDSEYIKRLKNSEEEAFKALVNAFSEKVLNLCYGFVRNTEDANDLSQEVFLEAYFSIKNFREESSISTWIHKIAVNKSLDFIKKQKRQKRAGNVLSLSGTETEDRELIIPDNHTPDTIYQEKERIQILKEAMDSLPESQRTVLNLSSIELFSYEEISEITGKSKSSVESLIFRAKKNLEKYLRDFFEKDLNRKFKF
jgi:RNA polymerase sigma factor (sigma-70 family)